MSLTSALAYTSKSTTSVGQPAEDINQAESVTSEPQEGEPTANMVPTAAAAQPPTHDDQPDKVLIVEDTVELAEVIAATLERLNIVALHETHGERALAVYRSENPNVVLLDLSLPDMRGWELLDVIKSEDEHKRPTVIVITAANDAANRLMGKLQGVHSYLIKPFLPTDVETVVQEALDASNQSNIQTVDSHAAEGAPAEDRVPEQVEASALPDFVQTLIEGMPEADDLDDEDTIDNTDDLFGSR